MPKFGLSRSGYLQFTVAASVLVLSSAFMTCRLRIDSLSSRLALRYCAAVPSMSLVPLAPFFLLSSVWRCAPAAFRRRNQTRRNTKRIRGPGCPESMRKITWSRKSSVSPGEKFALIYPTREFGESKEAKDFLVALNPFRVLATLPTDAPYFDDKSNSALGAEWSGDGSTALITLDSKWGPADIWLVELADEKVKRMTNLLEKVRELLRPRFRAVKPKPTAYNNANEFIFEEEEGGACQFAEKGLVRIYTKVTNDPKGISKRPWRVLVDAEWDIAQAKFVSQKITPERR